MRAVVVDDYGATPVVREVAEPAPAPGEVKVRVRASSVNGFDTLLAAGALKGMYEHRFPIVLGKDFAGTVEEIGDGVTEFAVGDEVFGVVAKAIPTDGGSFGEYLTTAAQTGITRIPPSLDHTAAGLLGLAGATAVAAIEALGLSEGETVLVSGATGGVGTYVVQLAAARGATVIATARSSAGTDHVRELGAHHVVDYRADLAAQVRQLTPNGGDTVVHLAGDGVALANLLTDGGRIASPLHLTQEQLGDRNVTATAVIASPEQHILNRLATDAASGRLRTPATRTYHLGDIPQALTDFTKGTIGKLAVTIT